MQTGRKVEREAPFRPFQRIGYPVHDQHRSRCHIAEGDDRSFAERRLADSHNARILHDEIIGRRCRAEQVGGVQVTRGAGAVCHRQKAAIHSLQDLIGKLLRTRRQQVHRHHLRIRLAIRIADRDGDVAAGHRGRRGRPEQEVLDHRLHVFRGRFCGEGDLRSAFVIVQDSNLAPADQDYAVFHGDGRSAIGAQDDFLTCPDAVHHNPAEFQVAVRTEGHIRIQQLARRGLCRRQVQRIDHIGQRRDIAYIHRHRIRCHEAAAV